jgi:hypothetical protein
MVVKRDRRGGLFHQTFGQPLQDHADASADVVQCLKPDRAGVRGAVDAAPRDDVVGSLLDDLGVELTVDTSDRDQNALERRIWRGTYYDLAGSARCYAYRR